MGRGARVQNTDRARGRICAGGRVLDESLRRLHGEAGVELEDHALVDAALAQLGELVAQGGDAGGGELRLAVQGGEVVPGVRLEGEHAAGHPPVARLVVQQRQHGLVAAVHAVEVADGHGARLGDLGVVEAAQDLHLG